MNKRIIIAIAAGVVVVGGITVAMVSQAGADTEPAATPTSTNTAVAQLPTGTTPTPTPSAGSVGTPSMPGEATEEGYGTGNGAADQGGAGGGLDLPGGVEMIQNVPEFRKVAEAAVRAYATVTPGETQEARAKRLAPYFAAGSIHLTEKPRIANPQSYVGIVATVTPLESITSSAYPDAITDTSYTFTVTMDYKAVYDASGNKMTVQKLAKWTVTMSPQFDGLIQTITEPTDLR